MACEPLATSNHCVGSRCDAASAATILYSLVERKEKETRAEAEREVSCLKHTIKEQQTNSRHASSQSTLKAMHQSHIPMTRRGVTLCVAVRENGKGGAGRLT
jgi:hypothetical protein